MWLIYPVLVIITIAGFALGVVPLGIVGLIALLAAIAYGLLAQGSQSHTENDPGRAERGGAAEAMPSTGEASYQPAGDPRRTGT